MSDPLEDLKKRGIHMEPDRGHTAYHRRIVSMAPIPHTRTGNTCMLECGHRVQTFGRIDLAGGKVLCQECRNAGTK